MTRLTIEDGARKQAHWQNFGRWLREQRHAKKLSQEKAAIAAGWSANGGKVTWSKYENGEAARKETVVKLAQGLDIDSNEALRQAGYVNSTYFVEIIYFGINYDGIDKIFYDATQDDLLKLGNAKVYRDEGKKLYLRLAAEVETTDISVTMHQLEMHIRGKLRILFYGNQLNISPLAWQVETAFSNQDTSNANLRPRIADKLIEPIQGMSERAYVLSTLLDASLNI